MAKKLNEENDAPTAVGTLTEAEVALVREAVSRDMEREKASRKLDSYTISDYVADLRRGHAGCPSVAQFFFAQLVSDAHGMAYELPPRTAADAKKVNLEAKKARLRALLSELDAAGVEG